LGRTVRSLPAREGMGRPRAGIRDPPLKGRPRPQGGEEKMKGGLQARVKEGKGKGARDLLPAGGRGCLRPWDGKIRPGGGGSRIELWSPG